MGRPSITWLITDTHFYDDDLCDSFCGRPKDFTKLIIRNMKVLIAPQDCLIHLGDVIDKQESKLTDILDSIKCKSKILIRGNHDKKSDNWYLNHGFDFICDSMICGNIALSHKPLKDIPSGIKVNIHGHFHNFDWQKNDKECAPYYNFSIHKLYALEYNGYKPVKMKEFANV